VTQNSLSDFGRYPAFLGAKGKKNDRRSQMSLRKPLAVILVVVLAAVILFLVASLPYENRRQTQSTGESSPPTISSFERDGEMISEFPVGDSVLQIPRKYAVRYSTPGNLNLVTHWPGLIASANADELEAEDRINIIFQPREHYPEAVDRDEAIQRYIKRTGLSGPEWDEGIGLFVYRDEQFRNRFMKSEDYPTATGGIYAITCGAASNRSEFDQECRTIYPLTDDLRIEYRFYSKHIPSWREIDADVRQFALTLIR
jgi:hypothetical protein